MPTDNKRLIDRTIYFLNNGDYLSAIKILHNVRKWPRNAEIQFYLAQCYEGLGERDNAINAYHIANQLTPFVPACAYNFCRYMIKTQQPYALQWLQHTLITHPQMPELHLLYINHFKNDSSYNEYVSTLFDRIIEQFPQFEPAYLAAIEYHAKNLHAEKVYFLHDESMSRFPSDQQLNVEIIKIIHTMEQEKRRLSSYTQQNFFQRQQISPHQASELSLYTTQSKTF